MRASNYCTPSSPNWLSRATNTEKTSFTGESCLGLQSNQSTLTSYYSTAADAKQPAMINVRWQHHSMGTQQHLAPAIAYNHIIVLPLAICALALSWAALLLLYSTGVRETNIKTVDEIMSHQVAIHIWPCKAKFYFSDSSAWLMPLKSEGTSLTGSFQQFHTNNDDDSFHQFWCFLVDD